MFDITDDFIIYDLALDDSRLTFLAHKKVETDEVVRNDAKYYFMEKTSRPNELLLVHRKVRGRSKSTPNKQLFQTPPVGFYHDGHLYMLDSILGCVYVVRLSNDLNLQDAFAKEENILLKRLNVPYERFFRCPDKILEPFPMPANRCETTDRLVHGKVPHSAERPTGRLDYHDTNTVTWMAIVFCMLLIILTVASAFIWFFYYGPGRRLNRSGKKRSALNLTTATGGVSNRKTGQDTAKNSKSPVHGSTIASASKSVSRTSPQISENVSVSTKPISHKTPSKETVQV